MDKTSARRRQPLLLCVLALPLLAAMYALILGYWARPASSGREVRIDEFLSLVEKGSVQSATILADDDRITGSYAQGSRYWVDFSGGHETLFARLTGALEQAKVPTEVRSQPLKRLVSPLSALLPVLILADLVLIATLMARGGGAFQSARARRGEDAGTTLTFADVAGSPEAVEELAEIRDYLTDPGRFAAMGAAVPRGALLAGPPGCGKTRLARALAGESGVPFFSISGSDFVEMFVGVGAARIRDLFAQAKAVAPAIVFIDEIDAVGRSRSAVATGGSDEREATLNQLLVEMDGFSADVGVVVLAATNRPDILDAALLRPGRFDRRITIELPDARGREAILSVHAGNKPLAADVDLALVARRTAGFSGADLANVVNEAALLATRARSAAIEPAHLSEAVERAVAGPTRRSRVLTVDDRRRIACHEAGHAVVAAALPNLGPTSKVSVLARGAGGHLALSTSLADRALATRSELLDRLTALLAGRMAEELCLGEPSTAANDDLARAAELARRLVTECGMSERLGALAFSAPPEASAPGWSEATAAEVDGEARAILAQSTERAMAILVENRSVLEDLTGNLVDAESLEGKALEAFLLRVSGAGRRVVALVAS